MRQNKHYINGRGDKANLRPQTLEGQTRNVQQDMYTNGRELPSITWCVCRSDVGEQVPEPGTCQILWIDNM